LVKYYRRVFLYFLAAGFYHPPSPDEKKAGCILTGFYPDNLVICATNTEKIFCKGQLKGQLYKMK